MKKIIATVLAMVMALALCTVAFADEWTAVAKLDGPIGEGAATGAHPAYYTKTVDGKTVYAVKSGDNYTILTDAQSDKYVKGQFSINLALYASAKTVTCSEDGYKVAVYQSAGGSYYAKKADVDAFNDANPYSTIDTTLGYYYIGSNFDNAVAYYAFGTSTAAVEVTAGHALYKTSDVWGKNNATVYACAICGAKFIVAGTQADSDNVKTLTKITYAPASAADVKTVLNAKGIDVNKAYTTASVLYTLTAGTTPATPDNGKDSPKTFDAGIAMYVGMALTSVAGSAVVIGKKKEF